MAMRTLTRVNRAYFIGLSVLRGEKPEHHFDWLVQLGEVTAADVERVFRAGIYPCLH